MTDADRDGLVMPDLLTVKGMFTYTCENSGVIFESTWTDAEAIEEAVQTFGRIPRDQAAVVCDDCFEYLRKISFR